MDALMTDTSTVPQSTIRAARLRDGVALAGITAALFPVRKSLSNAGVW